MIRSKIEYDKKRKSGEFVSLQVKMLGTMFIGALIAMTIFMAINLGTKHYVDYVYLSEENRAARLDAYEEQLQKYVTDNGITADDTDKLSNWARSNRYLYLLIYKDDKLMFESGVEDDDKDSEMEENKDNDVQNPDDSVENGENDGENEDADGSDTDSSESESNKHPSSSITGNRPTREELIADALKGGSHPIYTADDSVLLASMVDYTEYLYYDVTTVLSWVVALAAFFIIMSFHFYGLAKRISTLGKEVTLVTEGDPSHEIIARGNDEITRLSMDIEYMRVSMLDNLQRQKNALDSNKDLITAMSHDIRTPLTVLLGYLDIMKVYATDDDMKAYVEASESTALRLKKLSDDMFSYFLVYGGDIQVDIQACDARTLVEQLLTGHIFLLREQGYNIDYNFENAGADFLDDVTMVTDPPQLMRIVDNLFSNILKYADIDKPVNVFIDSFTDEMLIKVSNSPSPNPDKAQKNGIGLQSCLKLANAMDIRFSSGEEDGIFSTEMYIPIIPHIEYNFDMQDDIVDEREGFAGWLSSVSENLQDMMENIAHFFAKTFKNIKRNLTKKK